MSKRQLIDTNLIVRHLTQDHQAHTAAAGRLIDECDRGEITLVILPVVLAETLFVLESFYGHARKDIARILVSLISSPGIDLIDKAIYQNALTQYGQSKLHFVDCVIATYAKIRDLPIATFDKELLKLPNIKIALE